MLVIIVKTFKVEEILNDIKKLNIVSLSMADVQKFYVIPLRVHPDGGQEKLLLSIKIEVVVQDDLVPAVEEVLFRAATRGRIGDGKVFIIPIIEGFRLSEIGKRMLLKG